MLLSECLSLEGVRHNSRDVIMALSGFLKEERHRVDGSPLSLAYIDFTSCFTVFSQRLELLPGLTEVSSLLFILLLFVPPSKSGENRGRCTALSEAAVKEAPRGGGLATWKTSLCLKSTCSASSAATPHSQGCDSGGTGGCLGSCWSTSDEAGTSLYGPGGEDRQHW